jgi:hypothetical protein
MEMKAEKAQLLKRMRELEKRLEELEQMVPDPDDDMVTAKDAKWEALLNAEQSKYQDLAEKCDMLKKVVRTVKMMVRD